MAQLVLNNGYIVNDGKNPINFPPNFTARTFQDQINTAHAFASFHESNFFLFENFVWGGQGDLQRPSGALDGVLGLFQGKYTDAAAYLYGASAVSSGLTPDQALSAAGKLNRYSPSKGSNPYGLPPDRIKLIRKAYEDAKNNKYNPDSSTQLSTMLSILGKDFLNDPAVVVAFTIDRLRPPASNSYPTIKGHVQFNDGQDSRGRSSNVNPQDLYDPVVWDANNNGTFYNPRLRIRNQHGKVLQPQQPQQGKSQNLPPVSFRRRNPLYVSVDTLNPGYYNDDGIPHVQTSTSAKIVGYGSPYDNTNTPGATSNALQPLLQTNNIISPGAQAKTLPALVPPFIPPPVLLPSDEPIGPPSEPPQVFDQIIIDIGDGDG